MEEAMEKFGDPKQIAKDLSRQHLRRRRWLSALLKTSMALALTLLTLVIGYSAYWYIALSKPMEREPAPTPISSAAATLAAIQIAQDSYAQRIKSVQFQGRQTVRSYNSNKYEGEFTHTFEAASKGALYYSREVADERYGTKPDETRHSEDVWVFDGRTMRNLLTDWNGPVGSARAKETYGVSAYLRDKQFKPHDPDEMLHYGYKLDGVWIGDMLRRGKPTVEGTVADAQFGPLTVVRCDNKTSWGGRESVRLCLAPKLGWMAVKTETYQADARPPFALQVLRDTQRVVKIGDLWVTSEGRFRYAALGLGRRQEMGNQTRYFADIAFNNVPDSLFTVQYPAGTRFWTQATDAHPSMPTTLERYLAAPPVGEDSGFPLWTGVLIGAAAIGVVIGLTALGIKRRGQRLAA
jgi:hypothetical protein